MIQCTCACRDYLSKLTQLFQCDEVFLFRIMITQAFKYSSVKTLDCEKHQISSLCIQVHSWFEGMCLAASDAFFFGWERLEEDGVKEDIIKGSRIRQYQPVSGCVWTWIEPVKKISEFGGCWRVDINDHI